METPHSLEGEISGLTLLPAGFTTGLIGLLLPLEMCPVLLFPFCCLLCLSQRDVGQVSFLRVGKLHPSFLFQFRLNFIPLFFSNSALYGEAVMIFAEPGLEDFLHLALVVSCFETEDSGLRCVT